MFRYALKSLRANLTRLVATALAVILGIGFLAAGLMLTDAMRAGLTGDVEEQYRNVDLAVVTTAGAQASEFSGFSTVPAEILDTVRGTDGVAAAAGEVQGDARVLRPDGTTANLRSQGRSWITDDELNPLTVVDGRPPASGTEVALDRSLAREAKAVVGDTVTVETPVGERDMTVSGTTRFGDQDALDDGGTVSFSEDAAIEILNTGTSGYTSVLIRTSGDPQSVQRSLESSLPSSVQVQTGQQFVETAMESASAFIDFLRPVLQGFAYLAMFVAAFVIFNTFSVVVTQRFRELALIRAIGGTPAQVRRSLLVEGLGIGLGASALGIVTGMALAIGLQALLRQFDVALPGSGVKITIGTIVLCMIVGTVVTVLSVIVPAFRAGRTKPVEAMRASAVDTSGTSTVRAAFGGTFLLGSVALLLANRFIGTKWYYLAPGALFLFIGLFIGGPLLARVFALTLAAPLRRLGLTGRLAVDNTVRNPRRTATTANALVIGLFLVTLVTVSGEALKASTVNKLNELSSSDFIIGSEDGPVAPELIDDIDAVDGVIADAAVRSAVNLDQYGNPVYVSTADFDDLRQTAGITVVAGSLDDVANGNGVAITDLNSFGGVDTGQGISPEDRLGQTMEYTDVDGAVVELRVAAVLEGKLDSLFLGDLVGADTFERLAGEQPISMVFVRVEPGKADEVGQRLEKVLQGYAGLEVQPGNFIGQIVGTVFDFLIGAVNALLGMSVVVALVGIVNTMTLSIFERRRELGMVRALGMTRQQVGRMIRLEAVLIGLLGTVVGMGAGVLLSWVVVSSLGASTEGVFDVDLSFNWARVGLIFAVGILVGLLASIMPSRRGTRLDMLEAMQDT